VTAAQRIAALESRVTQLEQRLAAAADRLEDSRGAEAPVELDPDVFWALAGFEARVPPPGGVMVVGSVAAPSGRHARWQLGAVTDDLLDDDWSATAERLAALGHPVRLRLLQQVLRGTTTVRELTEVEGIGTSGQVYHHLRQLTATGWLRNRGSHFEVPTEAVVPLLATVLGGHR
jgi:Helix-turn-helix domain